MQWRQLMSEKALRSPETKSPSGLLNVSAQPLEELLNNHDDVLSNSVRRVRADAKNEENYAAFGNTP
jgi:hypothetical protein